MKVTFGLLFCTGLASVALSRPTNQKDARFTPRYADEGSSHPAPLTDENIEASIVALDTPHPIDAEAKRKAEDMKAQTFAAQKQQQSTGPTVIHHGQIVNDERSLPRTLEASTHLEAEPTLMAELLKYNYVLRLNQDGEGQYLPNFPELLEKGLIKYPQPASTAGALSESETTPADLPYVIYNVKEFPLNPTQWALGVYLDRAKEAQDLLPYIEVEPTGIIFNFSKLHEMVKTDIYRERIAAQRENMAFTQEPHAQANQAAGYSSGSTSGQQSTPGQLTTPQVESSPGSDAASESSEGHRKMPSSLHESDDDVVEEPTQKVEPEVANPQPKKKSNFLYDLFTKRILGRHPATPKPEVEVQSSDADVEETDEEEDEVTLVNKPMPGGFVHEPVVSANDHTNPASTDRDIHTEQPNHSNVGPQAESSSTSSKQASTSYPYYPPYYPPVTKQHDHSERVPQAESSSSRSQQTSRGYPYYAPYYPHPHPTGNPTRAFGSGILPPPNTTPFSQNGDFKRFSELLNRL
ncbi:hypothetical protein H4R33_003447 [Dimargaris cristalligena]|uniref:Uncharacterized protein n=1 Tax=Dimargaris cristalligena TaxID=215637 RepID=A0A4Q0A0D1_9FUNG|nr:hypothetical protein H4R33_003447 [Dimargaris cristalligena]RKP38881.1 hypothetical protein BJ085DRAFT_40835 [Dimargaris cristalligena]|eukprot:RKP38881.1 hypothetical protein BJ085DRAFT_40835 [Dimargaris cristalligena]